MYASKIVNQSKNNVENLQAENLELADGLSLVTSPDSTIASVTHAALEVEPEVEEDELEEGAEGEEGEEGSEEKSADDNQTADTDDSE